jgi:hypothetical protein
MGTGFQTRSSHLAQDAPSAPWSSTLHRALRAWRRFCVLTAAGGEGGGGAQAASVRDDSLERSRGPPRRQLKGGGSGGSAVAQVAAEPQQQHHADMDVREVIIALQTEGSSFVRAHRHYAMFQVSQGQRGAAPLAQLTRITQTDATKLCCLHHVSSAPKSLTPPLHRSQLPPSNSTVHRQVS